VQNFLYRNPQFYELAYPEPHDETPMMCRRIFSRYLANLPRYFILAIPPSSEGDDGFGYRRIVLRGARTFLMPDGKVFLSVSFQYGLKRVERLCQNAPGFVYGGILSSTDWVPFDLSRPDLLHCLQMYADAEHRGGLEYTFRYPDGQHDESISARTALAHFEKTGRSPLSKWQAHLLNYRHPPY
jgi:hypothetical protein